jgi:hypothetical protein
VSTGPRRRDLPALAARYAFAVAAVLVLTACMSIPRDGPVVPGRPAAGSDPDRGFFQIIAEGPEPDDTPEETVAGFVRAANGFGDDHITARSFLSPGRRVAWRPDASVDVYTGLLPTPTVLEATGASTAPGTHPSASSSAPARTPSPGAALAPTAAPATGSPPASGPTARSAAPSAPSAADPGRDRGDLARATVAIDVPVVASIDGDGRYTPQPAGKRRQVTYGLVRVSGDWRIDTVPDGILISALDFGVTFRSFPVYFPETGRRFLVPDIHWFPYTNAPAVPTALVRALLAGPANWLKPAVTTGAPPGTRMAVNSVVVSARTAIVDLNEAARNATPDERKMLALQLRETLSGLAQAVKITVQGADYDVPTDPWADDSGESGGGPRVDPPVDARPIVIDTAGRLARVEGSQVVPVPGVEHLAVPGASRPAMSSDGTVYAVLGPLRQSLLLQLPGGARATTAFQQQQPLTAPSFDPQGWVWTSPASNHGVLLAARTDAVANVSAPWLNGFEVSSVRASRDGARLLIGARRGGTAGVYVAAVRREPDGRPAQVMPPLSLVPDLQAVTDAAWVSEGQVVVLGRKAGSKAQQTWLVDVGGEITVVPSAPGATSITAGNGDLTLVAGSANGLLTRAGARWEQTPGARWPAFPG